MSSISTPYRSQQHCCLLGNSILGLSVAPTGCVCADLFPTPENSLSAAATLLFLKVDASQRDARLQRDVHRPNDPGVFSSDVSVKRRHN